MIGPRCKVARELAKHALDFVPGVTPEQALCGLIEAVALDFELHPVDAFLNLLHERDPDFDALVLLALGVNLDAPGAPCEDHRRDLCYRLQYEPATITSADVVRMVDAAAVTHDGNRRAALVDLIARGDELFADLLRHVAG